MFTSPVSGSPARLLAVCKAAVLPAPVLGRAPFLSDCARPRAGGSRREREGWLAGNGLCLQNPKRHPLLARESQANPVAWSSQQFLTFRAVPASRSAVPDFGNCAAGAVIHRRERMSPFLF